MAKDIEIIGTIKTYINIILSAFLSINLIKHIYNLLLTTLGIDNPYVIEAPENDTSITETQKIKMKSGKVLTQTRRYKGGK